MAHLRFGTFSSWSRTLCGIYEEPLALLPVCLIVVISASEDFVFHPCCDSASRLLFRERWQMPHNDFPRRAVCRFGGIAISLLPAVDTGLDIIENRIRH